MSGQVFTVGFSQGVGLNLIHLYGTFNPKIWLSPFVNMDPDPQIIFQLPHTIKFLVKDYDWTYLSQIQFQNVYLGSNP